MLGFKHNILLIFYFLIVINFSVVEYQDVVPSTDLPPYIKGKPQCFLCVTVGKLTWSNSARSLYKLPLVSSTYVRLKWWGDSSMGTYFRLVSDLFSFLKST